MCDDERGLLRTICEQPDCDVPRLVYADWLEERGQEERAEFIRESIAHAESDNAWTLQPHVYGNREWNANIGLGSGQYYYRRGLVDEVRCTLAEFMDNPLCKWCNGIGWVKSLKPAVVGAQVMPSKPCKSCQGTGTLPGLASTLFGEHPITSVVLSNRKPERFDDPEPRYSWRQASTADRTHHLPRDIWSMLRGGYTSNNREGREQLGWLYTCYGMNSALAALSLAAVNYARSLHDLPLLTKEQVTA